MKARIEVSSNVPVFDRELVHSKLRESLQKGAAGGAQANKDRVRFSAGFSVAPTPFVEGIANPKITLRGLAKGYVSDDEQKQ